MSSQTSGPFARDGLASVLAAAALAAERMRIRESLGWSCMVQLPYTLA
jgi:hypothetical protein